MQTILYIGVDWRMKFVRSEGGGMVLETADDLIEEMKMTMPISSTYIVDIPRIKSSIKSGSFLKNKSFSIAPIGLMMGAVTPTGGSGVFWDAFMRYIFPWMLDVAKVYCAIRICQAFYQEKRGGRDDGTGFGALVQYGKWYLVFWLIPWGVELIDQIGSRMLNDLRAGG